MEGKKRALLAKDIYKFCIKKNLWGDCCLYFNGKAWASWETWGEEVGKKIEDRLYEYENRNPKDYFNYVNPNTLSMSFEGPLYHVLNAYVSGWSKLEQQFSKIFEKHGCYYEMGHAWNLSVFE